MVEQTEKTMSDDDVKLTSISERAREELDKLFKVPLENHAAVIMAQVKGVIDGKMDEVISPLKNKLNEIEKRDSALTELKTKIENIENSSRKTSRIVRLLTIMLFVIIIFLGIALFILNSMGRVILK